ncbi:MAG: hypothetical protein IPM11_01225 [Micropruina sp.]|nr:hypothetical protein [Micropruina sp.]
MAFVLPLFSAVGSALGGLFGATGAATGAALAGDFVGAGVAAGAAGATGAAASGFSLGTALTVGSSLLGAAGAIQQGHAAKQAAEYNASVQEAQAKVAQDQGAAKATEIAQRTKQKLAAARAGSMENGLELSGSVGDVLETVQKQGALDELTALYDSNLRAEGLRRSAEAERAKGGNSIAAGYMNAGTSLLTGFSKLYRV